MKQPIDEFSIYKCFPNCKELYLLKFTCNKNSPSWKFRPSPNFAPQLSWTPLLSAGEDFNATMEKGKNNDIVSSFENTWFPKAMMENLYLPDRETIRNTVMTVNNPLPVGHVELKMTDS